MSDKDTLYARWLSGDLSDAEEEALKASGEWQELEAIIQAADQLSLPAFDAEAAYQKFKNKGTSVSDRSPHLKAVHKSDKQSTTRQFRLMRVAAVAASIVLVLAVLYLFQGQSSTSISADLASNEAHRFVDESSVVLNDGSTIQYQEANWGTERRVELKGEALFEVEKGKPFYVETRYGIVEVLGTQFNVRAWGKNLYVECYSGRVKVRTAQGAEILTKGQSVNVLKGTLQGIQNIQHTEPLWRTGVSRFYDENLNSVFEELARQYDIEVKTPRFNRSFSGVFKHDDLEVALRQICKPLGLAFEVKEGEVVVSKK